MRAGFRGRVARVFQPTRSWHFAGVARYLHPVHYRYVGLRFWHMFQGLGEETAGQRLVINTRLVEYPVEARPIAVSKPESHQCLGDGAPGEREQVPEEESLHSAEGALLAESTAVGDEEATECFEQRGRSGNIVHGKGILLHVMGFIPPASGRNSILVLFAPRRLELAALHDARSLTVRSSQGESDPIIPYLPSPRLSLARFCSPTHPSILLCFCLISRAIPKSRTRSRVSAAVAARMCGSTGSLGNPATGGNSTKRLRTQVSTTQALSKIPKRVTHLPGPNSRLTARSPWQTATNNMKEPLNGRATNSDGSNHRWISCEAKAREAAAYRSRGCFIVCSVAALFSVLPIRGPRNWPSSSCPRARGCGNGRRTCPESPRSGRPPALPLRLRTRCPSSRRRRVRAARRCGRGP